MRKSLVIFAGAIICLFLVRIAAEEPSQNADRMASPALVNTSSLKLQSPPAIDPAFGKMPLYFIRNEGQVDSRVGYYIQGKDKTIYFTSGGLTFVLSERGKGKDGDSEAASMNGRPESGPDGATKEAHVGEISSLDKEGASKGILGPERGSSGHFIARWVVKLDFVGANPDVQPSGEEKTQTVISYFKGSPEEWKTGLPTYSKLIYRELWPGIDLVYYGSTDRLKYEFIVHPGADPSQIRLAYRGASSVELNRTGRLEVETPEGGFEDDAPVAWQEVDGKRTAIPISYELKGQAYGFQVGEYDNARALILDPAVFIYCGYIGGSGYDLGQGIAADSAGNAYVTGETWSSGATFPVIAGPDLTFNGGDCDAFVAKVDSSGTALVYCGYIGGSGWDAGRGIGIDNSGNAFVTGITNSFHDTFPVIMGPDVTFNGGYYDAFVAKVDSSGTALSYCGYIGGVGDDYGQAIAVDTSGRAYVTGTTLSTESSFPVLWGPDLDFNGGSLDAFVAKVNSYGSALWYCGYIGGLGGEEGRGIALDSSRNAYITGYTSSNQDSFPVKIGPDLTFNEGLYDAFVAKVDSFGAELSYCGYIGGSDLDYGYGIAADSAGNAYITGGTRSDETTFPVKEGPHFAHSGNFDGFAAKVDSSGTVLSYCGYIGGSGDDNGQGIAVDSGGNAYVAGYTSSTEASFPVKTGPDLTYNGGQFDAFAVEVSSLGTAVSYCGYIGGSGDDCGQGIAVDSGGNAYVTGYTLSTEASFPVKKGPDLMHNGMSDAYLAKISNSVLAEDILGTWDKSGVWYRDTQTVAWWPLSTPASLISAGDFDNDGTDDLIGVWSSGLWVRYTKTKSWAKLSANIPLAIASGDMSGDGRDDVVGSWSSGIWYRNSATGAWALMSSSPASLLAAGYVDGDNKEDLIGAWSTGLWVKNSKTGSWTKLGTNLPTDLASGDMNGDGRDDAVGTWATGVWYRNSRTSKWVLMSSSPASQVAAGDIDADDTDDLLSAWSNGIWVKESTTGTWWKIPSSVPRDMDAGLFRTGQTVNVMGFASPVLISAEAPGANGYFQDLSSDGPGGGKFRYEQEENLIPFERDAQVAFGPGDPGLQFEVQENLLPRESMARELEKGKKATKR